MSVKGLRTLPEYLGSVIRRDAPYRTEHFVLAGWLHAPAWRQLKAASASFKWRLSEQTTLSQLEQDTEMGEEGPPSQLEVGGGSECPCSLLPPPCLSSEAQPPELQLN